VDLSRVAIVAAVLSLAVLALLVVLWSAQRGMLYFPDGRAVPAASSVLEGGEDVAFPTEDGLRLSGWLVPSRGPTVAAVLVLNGNAGNRSDRAPLAAALSREGFAVLLFDYRGYGRNTGEPTEVGLLRDARAAAAYLATRAGGARIAYLGESLGAAVAVALAAERPPLALVLRSPFTSLADIGAHHYPYLPVHPLLLHDTYPSIERIGAVRAPVLVIAGERDRIVPPTFSRRLYEAAAEPKRYVLVPGADHNDRELLAGENVVAEMARFIRDAARVAKGPDGSVRT
jgi:fermentation-respiration switch protein FrsA (DUF1100 family)